VRLKVEDGKLNKHPPPECKLYPHYYTFNGGHRVRNWETLMATMKSGANSYIRRPGGIALREVARPYRRPAKF